MRKLIMWNVITLDGYFDGTKNWDLDFHNLVWGKELEAFSLQQLHAADFLVFGRVTYEGMAAYWSGNNEKNEIARLMNSLPKLVFSRTLLDKAEWNNTTLISTNPSDEIRRRKQEGNGDMYVFGSADLSKTFINDNLFDEYRICVAPAILGKGRTLFTPGSNPINLRLLSTQQLENGGVVLRYGK